MNTTFSRRALATVALLSFVLVAGQASADMVSYRAELKGSSEIPANVSKGTGTADVIYDSTSKKLSWTITYAGLSGPATAAHFHGPAATTANAPPVVPISGNLASPIKGDATLTEAQLADLQAGRWYLNVHTAANKDGEVRGQVVKK